MSDPNKPRPEESLDSDEDYPAEKSWVDPKEPHKKNKRPRAFKDNAWVCIIVKDEQGNTTQEVFEIAKWRASGNSYEYQLKDAFGQVIKNGKWFMEKQLDHGRQPDQGGESKPPVADEAATKKPSSA